MLIEEMNPKQYREAMMLYESALEEFNAKLKIWNREFEVRLKTNPIEHIISRLKSPASIAAKLKHKGVEATLENAVMYVDDIAGIRIICSFNEDIYMIASVIEAQPFLKILRIKDYIRHPKANGYRSYHMILEIPVYLSGKAEFVKIEVQIRTIAMDFWASLEHKIRYKFDRRIPESINNELLFCADMVSSLDEKMEELNREVNQYSVEGISADEDR